MTSCLSADAVARYIASDVSAAGLADVEAHVDRCDQCRRTIAATIRAGRSEAPSDDVAVGARIGRYVVAAHHGTGAMGHVLEASDPDLDRRVAIKIVRHHGDAADARALREGRALARLAHPNIVAIYDVGVWDGGVFLAMELVHGTSLRAWIAEPRTPREIVRVFAAVARGLAAAHAAGVVHRDVKPDNLVIADAGRVRIIDFGLAIADAQTAGAAGTPKYMAPEQRTGGAGPAADQYAFMVSLDESFASRRIPRWLRSVIARGLRPEPSERHRDMTAVANALEAGLARPRRVLFAGAVAGAAIIGAASVMVALRGGDTCATVDDGIDPSALRPISELAATKLAEWRTRTAEIRAAACGDGSPAARARLACVDRVARDVHVVVDALAHADARLASGAVDAIERATDLAPCEGNVAPASDTFATAPLRMQLAAMAVRDASGDWQTAERGATAVAQEAARIGARDVEADAWTQVGRARMTARHTVDARAAYERALVAAEAAGDDQLRASIYFGLVGANLETPRRPDARRWLAQARALVDKSGDSAQRWRLLLFDGVLDEDPLHGVAAIRAALAAYTARHPLEDENTVMLIREIASAYESAGKYDDAATELRRAIALGERVLGPNHPDLVRPLQRLGSVLATQGHTADALIPARRALAIAEATHGDVGMSTLELGLALMQHGEFKAALELLDRGLVLLTRLEGERGTLLGSLLMLRGMVHGQLDQHADAVRDYLRSLEIHRTWLPPEAPEIIHLFEFLGKSQRAIEHFDDALRSLDEARALRARRPEHKPVDNMNLEIDVGGTLVEAGRPIEALPHLELALQLARTTPDSEAIAVAELELAKALIATQRDRARTVTLLRDARTRYAAFEPDERTRLASFADDIDAQLAKLGADQRPH